MAIDLHGIVQDATNADQIGPRNAIEQDVSRLSYQTIGRSSSASTVAQMVAAHGAPEFRPCHAAGTFGIRCNVSQTGNQQCLVAPPRDLAEPVLRVREELDDVLFRGRGKSIDRHRSSAGSVNPMTSMPPKRRDEILQFVILHVAVAALVEIGKTRLSRLLQSP